MLLLEFSPVGEWSSCRRVRLGSLSLREGFVVIVVVAVGEYGGMGEGEGVLLVC